MDARNPVIIYQDDWSGDWLAAYAFLLANNGGPHLAGIVVNSTKLWPDLKANSSGWKDLMTVAQTSGLKGIPNLTASAGGPLVRPDDGQIDSTVSNYSAGAQMIVDVSRQLSTASRPVVVVSGTSLTDVADAYLLDPTVVERVVVVAALGSYVAPEGLMNAQNGDLDPWADRIVAQRFRYIQVSGFYDQNADVTVDDVPNLPQNALGSRMASMRSHLIRGETASDQVALLAVALPKFVVSAQRVSPDTSAKYDSTKGPSLLPDAAGNDWLVTQVEGAQARSSLWHMLLAPSTFGS